MPFTLDTRLQSESLPVLTLGLCELRLMNDSRWPWLVLVPQREEVSEWHALTPLDQTMLTFEATMVGKALKEATECLKINTGMLGNIVHQLHIHVVARNEGDPGWPGPVWGHGTATAYGEEDAASMIASIKARL